MNGQWVGTFVAENPGDIVVNIDDLGETYQGIAYLCPTGAPLPVAAALFQTPNKRKTFKARARTYPINQSTLIPDSWENVKKNYADDVVFPEFADVKGAFNGKTLELSWKSNIGTEGHCKLPKSRASEPSDLVSTQMTWRKFKTYVGGLESQNYLFRGQASPWRLRTSYHRSGRANLARYIQEDIPILHRQLSATTRHVFNLDVPNENGAFYNLIQHHGFPTPLLDWTYSPFAAAFFAYREVSRKDSKDKRNADKKVRIHVFDQARWKTGYKQMQHVLSPHLHFSIGEFLAIDNLRMVPQQAACAVTNADDVESYIAKLQRGDNPFLQAIDIPWRARDEVMHELRLMGVTAAAMFPGLDGACEALRERRF